MSTEETAFAVSHTKRLIQEYERIIEEYQHKGAILDKLIDYDIKMESQFKEWLYELKNG